MALTTTQRKTLRDILRNYIHYLLEKKLTDWLPKLITPVKLTFAEMVEKLRKNPENIKTLTEAVNLPFEIRSSWLLFAGYITNPSQELPQEALRQLESHPNYNPYNLLDMQLFEASLAEVEEESKKALVALRELYLEMTPLIDYSYGQNYRTFFFRIGRTPLNLDSFGPLPQAGEIQTEVEDYIQERYELALESQKELEALTQRLRVSEDRAFAAQLLQEEALQTKQPIPSASSSVSTFSSNVNEALEGEPNLTEAYFALGEKYYSSKEYAEAMKWYQKAAMQGYAQAQCSLGSLYCLGQGVNQDSQEAVKWFEKAAEQGLDSAQYYLGLCYKKGDGVAQDYSEAVKWYQKAAMQGHSRAQTSLAYCYSEGRGLKQDYKEALKWYLKAAEQGDVQAQCNLGAFFGRGQGVKQDYKEALKWYLKAAEQGETIPQYNVGYYYEKGQGIAQSYLEAVKWYQKAAEQGCARAQYRLGLCYANGQGVAQNYLEAVRWYQKAAEQDDKDAKAALKRIGSSSSSSQCRIM